MNNREATQLDDVEDTFTKIFIEYNCFKEDKDYQNALILNQKLYEIIFKRYLDYCDSKRELVSKKEKKDSLEGIEMWINMAKWNLEFLEEDGQCIVEYLINKSEEEKQ